MVGFMKLYFVIDLLHKEVVRAVKGEREKYRPIHLSSRLLDTSDPQRAIELINPRYVYAADLDRIMGEGDNTEVINCISGKVEHLIADCGFKWVSELDNLGFDGVVGSETFNLRQLEESSNVRYVSLDIKDGFLDASNSFRRWEEALGWLNSFDLKGVVILTLSRVGTLSLDQSIFSKSAELSDNPLYAGGGIKSQEDIVELKELGFEGALIASAFHEGSIDPEVVRRGRIN
ncbi:MAG: HisA/HisF family protein [Archaeoglobaceae archaeon]